MNGARILAAILLMLALPLMADEHPNVAKGFAADQVYRFGDLDHVNLFNGGLNLALPIGGTFHVNGNLAFQLVLTNSSNTVRRSTTITMSRRLSTRARLATNGTPAWVGISRSAGC